jgi:hypothetical protein
MISQEQNHRGIDLQSSPEGIVEGVGIVVFLGVVPVAIGAAIGTPIGKKIERAATATLSHSF